MSGYSPHLKVTPQAGPVIDFDLTAIPTLTVQKYFAEPIFQTKETVRRRLRNIKYGWRIVAVFEWVVDAGSASELGPNFDGLGGLRGLTYHVNRNGSILAVNFNAGGDPYRECVLSAWSRTYPEDKLIGLGIWHMEFASVDLLSEDSLPPEILQAPPGLMEWHG